VRRPRGAGFRALPSGSVTEARDTGLWAFPTKEFKLLVFQLVGRNEKLLDLLAHHIGIAGMAPKTLTQPVRQAIKLGRP